MNPQYNRVNAPILRSPLLFHQAPIQSASPNYYPTQPSSAPSRPQFYLPNTKRYTLQPRYTVQAPLPIYPHSYYPAFPLPTVSSQTPISACSVPSLNYATVSSKGLTLILIAILILVALDLVIVRPQKLNTLGVNN